MSKGYALLEVMISAMIIFSSVDMIFRAVVAFPKRETTLNDSPWDQLNEGCDHACVLEADLP